MGKNSLIKSTAKKKAVKKAAGKATAKAAASKPSAKKSAKKTAPKKAPAKKTAVKKAPAKKTTKKVTLKDLIFKKFDPLQPPAMAKMQPSPQTSEMTAPPFEFGDDPKETARIRKLLFAQFSMADIKAAAKEPTPVKPPADSQPPAETKPEPVAAKASQAPATTKPQAKTAPAVDSAAPETVESLGAGLPSQPPDTADTPPDPVERAIKYGIAALVALIVLLIGASYKNSTKFYIQTQDDAIEVWRGQFSPKGKSFYAVLHGLQPTLPAKEVYTRQDVFPMIFSYYLDKADALLDVDGLPDFEGIREYLHKANQYAIANTMRDSVNTRLNTIERMILLYKVDVAINKGTAKALQSAIKNLKQAERLTANAAQEQMIKDKIALVNERQATLAAEAEAAAKEKEKEAPKEPAVHK